MYKVRDNVYWETESSKLRMDATPFSEDTSTHPSSQSVSAVVSAPVHLSGAEATDAANDPKDIERESAAAMSPPDIESAVNEVGEPLLSFVPTVSQESDAWAVIQKWHLVADARIRRRPNFDLYLTSNDELISTSSQLTYSVTEAPSTGGFGASLGPNSCSKGGLDSPSVFSQGSSYMLDQVQSYGHTAGPFKDTVRGNYVIKLGKVSFIAK